MGENVGRSSDLGKEVSAEKNSLQYFLNVDLLCHKYLEKDVSELTDEDVSASDVYFEHANEQVLFLYPNLDLNLPGFLKVVQDGALVDEETFASPKSPASIEETPDHDGNCKAESPKSLG